MHLLKYSSLAPFTRPTQSHCANNRRSCAWCGPADKPHMRDRQRHETAACRSEHTRHLPLNRPAKWLKPHTVHHKQRENIRTSTGTKISGYGVTKADNGGLQMWFFSSTRFFPQYVAELANMLTRPGLTNKPSDSKLTLPIKDLVWVILAEYLINEL